MMYNYTREERMGLNLKTNPGLLLRASYIHVEKYKKQRNTRQKLHTELCKFLCTLLVCYSTKT